MKAFYSDTFVLPLPERHRFPMTKYRLLRERLVDEGILSASDLHVPEPISWDGLRLVDSCSTAAALDTQRPNLVFYVAGADPYEGDRLERLKFTIDGLRARDRIVFDACRDRDLPVVVAMSGDYAPDVDAIVTIHTNTIREAVSSQRRTLAPVGALCLSLSAS